MKKFIWELVEMVAFTVGFIVALSPAIVLIYLISRMMR